MTKKETAARLLREYDETKRRLWALETELQAACHDYGKEQGYLWLSPDAFRTILITQQEQAQRLDQKADQSQWEKAHG